VPTRGSAHGPTAIEKRHRGHDGATSGLLITMNGVPGEGRGLYRAVFLPSAAR
jgi:hypothetical protein